MEFDSGIFHPGNQTSYRVRGGHFEATVSDIRALCIFRRNPLVLDIYIVGLFSRRRMGEISGSAGSEGDVCGGSSGSNFDRCVCSKTHVEEEGVMGDGENRRIEVRGVRGKYCNRPVHWRKQM